MKRSLISILSIIVLVALLAGASVAHAQDAASLTAMVDRNNLTIDETFVLTLSLYTPDGSMPQLALPLLDDFRVIGNSQSLQTSIINGVTSASAIYTYELQPIQVGEFTIPSLNLNLNGQLLSTDSIPVLVTPGSGSANTSPAPTNQLQSGVVQSASSTNRNGTRDFFIEADADKQSLYMGEPVKFITRLYNSSLSFGQPSYEAPKFVGFWHPQKPNIQQDFALSKDGTNYEVTELTTWLFPTSPGQATIDPATFTVPEDFFTRGAQVRSDPISIEVKPLPNGAPANFNGAVGKFEIIATSDRLSTRLGEPVTLRVELSGTGNWGTLSDPQWPSDASWRMYNQDTRSQSDIDNGQMTGSRTYEQLWTPLTEGKLTLPAISYAYFDPETGHYHTITTQPQTIDVAPGDPKLAASLPNQASSITQPISTSGTVVEQIKPVPNVLTSAARPLAQQTSFGLLFLVPLALVISDLGLAYRKHYLEIHAAHLRRSRAYKRARRQLQRIPLHSKNVQLEIGHILLTYLEDQIQQPLTGLSHTALAQVLQAHHFSPELAQRVIEALFIGEASEYTPRQPADRAQAVRSAAMLLEDLENKGS